MIILTQADEVFDKTQHLFMIFKKFSKQEIGVNFLNLKMFSHSKPQ